MTWSAALGHVFLFDLEARQRVSAWTVPPDERGFSDAAGVALDEHFHLYVADPHNDRVRHFSVFGRHLGDFGRPAPKHGDKGRDRPGFLERPYAVAMAKRRLYIAGGDLPRRHAVQCLDRSGQVHSVVRPHGDVEQKFGAPRGLWADAAGLVVADTLHGQLQRFRPDGTFVAAVALGPRDARSRPVAVARRRDGSMVVVDDGDAPGCSVFAVDGQQLPIGTALADRSEHAVAVTLDQHDRLYVLDQHGERVLRFGPDLSFDRIVVDLAEYLDDYDSGGSRP